jgi:Do/DeqQ family serine protease
MHARRFTLALVLVSSGFVAGLTFLGRARVLDDVSAQTTTPTAVRAGAPAPAQAPAAPVTLPDFTRVADQTIPAVVNVSSRQVVQRRSPLVADPFGFFGDDFFGAPSSRVENSLGSGVIVSSDGYILTNNHVVTGEPRGAPQKIDITVALSDKRELPARVIGVDPATDLALLKIEAKQTLPTITWGDSDRLKVAEWVLAIGNPYQLNETVTLGIVSAVNRRNVGINAYEDFIQTDAAINPGNSGGALVNARGELVGINSAIFSQSGGYQGIGFAVASNLARQVQRDLQQFGEVRRGSIGYVRLAPITDRLASELGLTDARGIFVDRMRRDSAAYEGGLRPGDVIVAFDGKAVTDGSELSRMIQDARIGSTVVMTVIRERRRVELKVPIRSTSQR